MPIGRKLYYDKNTGDVVLHIPEKHHEDAVDTTKAQDFETYSVLQNRNPDVINVLKIPYGENRGDFEKAKSIKVNTDTKEVIFDFPIFEQAHGAQIRTLKAENENKTKELALKDEQIASMGMDLAKEKQLSGTLEYQNASIMMRLARNKIM